MLPRTALDPSFYNGKVLRLSSDGSTPHDQASATPVLVSGVLSPRGLGFDPDAGLLWVATRTNSVPAT